LTRFDLFSWVVFDWSSSFSLALLIMFTVILQILGLHGFNLAEFYLHFAHPSHLAFGILAVWMLFMRLVYDCLEILTIVLDWVLFRGYGLAC
jgi:hypothetical protein